VHSLCAESVIAGELDNGTVYSSNSPLYVEIPRKAKLFRVIMERKLGIDWEHTFISSDQEQSLQTFEV
jgi:hypothetical protein